MGDETKKTSLSASELWKMEEFRMKMKKMLAILAALSVLGTTGLTVGAEDTATTTEPATEAITTTETEAETTAAETTAETETETTVETDVTEETAATEENQVVGKIGETAEFTFNGIKFQAVELDPQDDPDPTAIYVTLKINRIEADGSIVETNLSNVNLFTLGDGGGSGSNTPAYLKPVLDFISIDGDILTIDAYGGNQSYQYVDGQFIPAGTAPTTTTTTAAETTTTTTTTTVDPAETEEALLKIFEEYVAEKQAEDISTGGIKSFYYDAAAKKAYGVYGWNGSMHDDALCIITKDGVSEQHIDGTPGEFNSIDFKESVCFTCNGSTFIAAIVDIHHAVAPLYVLNIYDVNGSEPIKTNLYSIYIGNTIKDYAGLLITDPNSSTALDDYFTVKSDSVIVVNGVDYTYDTASAQFVKVGDSDSGKTDNGSASNAPATKNTSSTPKTGDMTTVPAVAVGLTLTAAGVVAFISKRKK